MTTLPRLARGPLFRAARAASLSLALAPLASLRAQSLDPAFTPSANAEVFAVASQPDGRILIGGDFSSIGGVARSRVARLNSDGSVDLAFNAGVNGTVRTVALQPDGKIIVGGGFSTAGSVIRNYIARFEASGALDTGFNPSSGGNVQALALQSDGRILVGGNFTAISGVNRAGIARLNADGTLENAVDFAVSGTLSAAPFVVEAIVVQPDGKIIFGGNFGSVAGQARRGLARMLPDGTLDLAFVPPALSSSTRAIALQPDGKILIAGNFTQVAGRNQNFVARLNANGSFDATFTPPIFNGAPGTMVLQPDGKLLLGGGFTSVGGVQRARLARLNADGSLDTTFNVDVAGSLANSTGVYSLAVPRPNEILISGAFSTIDGQPRSGLARFGSPLPAITRQPMSLAANVGANVTLSVTATGDALRYQWRRNGVDVAGATSATLSLPGVEAAAAGVYTVVVSNSLGSVVSGPAALTLGPAPDANTLALLTPIAPQHATVGGAATLSIGANGSGLTYQWKRNGVALAGATNAVHTLSNVRVSDMGLYTVVVSSGGSALESAAGVLTVSGPQTVSRLTNVSTRGFVPAGGALIPGFVLRGAGTRQILVRGVGPTLTRFALTGILPDPRIELLPFGGAAPVLENDNWSTNANASALLAASTAVGAFPLDSSSADAAALTTLTLAPTSGYTVRISAGDATASGLVLAEVYDVDLLRGGPELINVSTRGFVGTGASALVPGFFISGDGPKRLLIRAVGPALEQFGVTGVLADPQLAIVPAGGTAPLFQNDDWGGGGFIVDAAAAVGAFPLPATGKDAALLVRLPPGGYTVIVSGVGNTTGNALVEIYDVP